MNRREAIQSTVAAAVPMVMGTTAAAHDEMPPNVPRGILEQEIQKCIDALDKAEAEAWRSGNTDGRQLDHVMHVIATRMQMLELIARHAK